MQWVVQMAQRSGEQNGSGSRENNMEQTAGLHVLCLTLRRRCRLSSLEVPPRGPLVMILGIYACVSSRIDAISSAVDMVSLPPPRVRYAIPGECV